MSESYETQYLRHIVEFNCSRCGYENWARLSQIIVSSTVICACCHTRLKLESDRGSVEIAGREISASVEELQSVLRNLF